MIKKVKEPKPAPPPPPLSEYKTIREVTYIYADQRPASPSPFVGQVFALDEERGDSLIENGDSFAGDSTEDTLTIIERGPKRLDGTVDDIPVTITVLRKGFLWREVRVRRVKREKTEEAR